MIEFLASANPVEHVMDKPVMGSITLHMTSLFAAAIIAMVVLLWAAQAISTGSEKLGTPRFLTRGRLPQLVEVITIYLIDNAIRPILREDAARYTPFLLSLFFFILTCNVLGLIPFSDLQATASLLMGDGDKWALFGGTATANLAVTLGLALFAFVAIQWQGFRSLGVKGWLGHLTGGAPLFLLPIMLPVELLGMIIKPVALAIRLFANMLAGHTLMAVVASFGMMAWMGTESYLTAGSIELISIIAAIPIAFLELFVAFLQAFIFMFLTSVFIGQMTHFHDEHDDAHDAAEHVESTPVTSMSTA
jgi:F-type H+-transporting ATPase subunit a